MRIFLNILLSFFLLLSGLPAYAIDFSPKEIENHTLKISRKFSKTYCNTIKFGISNEGALKFATNETNKEFLKNKLNKFVDFEILKEKIIMSLENNCEIYSFPEFELNNLSLD